MASSSEISSSRALSGRLEVGRDVEVEQGPEVAALVADLRDEHVHRVPVLGVAGGGDVGDHDHPVDEVAGGSEKLSSGIKMKLPKVSPSAKTACMSERREAVPSRSSALVMSP